jgi:hypothetical protein
MLQPSWRHKPAGRWSPEKHELTPTAIQQPHGGTDEPHCTASPRHWMDNWQLSNQQVTLWLRLTASLHVFTCKSCSACQCHAQHVADVHSLAAMHGMHFQLGASFKGFNCTASCSTNIIQNNAKLCHNSQRQHPARPIAHGCPFTRVTVGDSNHLMVRCSLCCGTPSGCGRCLETVG